MKPTSAGRVGEGVVAEADHRALRPGLDPLDVRRAAKLFDGNHFQQVVDLVRQRAEAIDQFGGEGVDGVTVGEVAEPAVEAEPHAQVGDVALGDQHAQPERDSAGSTPCACAPVPSALRASATASSSMFW